jgi:hypothetical protein
MDIEVDNNSNLVNKVGRKDFFHQIQPNLTY